MKAIAIVQIHHRYLTNRRPTAHRYTSDTLPMLSRLTVDRFDGWYSTESKHHLADISTDSRRCKLSTDTPLIPHRYSTDDSHCRQTTDAILTDCRSICWPTRKHHLTKMSVDTQQILDWHLGRESFLGLVLANIAANISINSPPKDTWSYM